MKKTIIALAAVLFTLTSVMAQKQKIYAKIFYTVSPVETSDVSITAETAVSTDKETKFKLKIKNLTADYIIFKPEESKFLINGKELKPDEKWLVISPNEDDWRVINLKGGGYNSATTYSYEIDGLYKISSNTKGIETPDFRLPATKK